MTSNLTSRDTISLSRTVFEIFNFKVLRVWPWPLTPKGHLGLKKFYHSKGHIWLPPMFFLNLFLDLQIYRSLRAVSLQCLSRPLKSQPVTKKPGLDQSDPSNYCPISNLNNISKLLDLSFSIVSFSISIARFEFTKFLPTAVSLPPLPLHRNIAVKHALPGIHGCWLQSANNPCITWPDTNTIQIQIRCIRYHILLTRLQTGFGISGSVINWIRSYLGDSVQMVVFGQVGQVEIFDFKVYGFDLDRWPLKVFWGKKMYIIRKAIYDFLFDFYEHHLVPFSRYLTSKFQGPLTSKGLLG